MNKLLISITLLFSAFNAFGQNYAAVCDGGRLEGNTLNTGIKQGTEVSDNGVSLDQTVILFTYPVSVGDEAIVRYGSDDHPAIVTYSSLEFFTVSHSPNKTEERYTIHMASETAHYSLVKTYDFPDKTLSTQTFGMECTFAEL
ncbi:MAG: hypothetical protein PsegKO_13680 [Pseudohongiellaceae bacterium]